MCASVNQPVHKSYLGAETRVPYNDALKCCRDKVSSTVIIAYIGVGRRNDAESLSFFVAEVRLHHRKEMAKTLQVASSLTAARHHLKVALPTPRGFEPGVHSPQRFA